MKKIKEFYKKNKGTIDKMGVAVAIVGIVAIAVYVAKKGELEKGIEIGIEIGKEIGLKEGIAKVKSPAQWSADGRYLNFMKNIVNVA